MHFFSEKVLPARFFFRAGTVRRVHLATRSFTIVSRGIWWREDGRGSLFAFLGNLAASLPERSCRLPGRLGSTARQSSHFGYYMPIASPAYTGIPWIALEDPPPPCPPFRDPRDNSPALGSCAQSEFRCVFHIATPKRPARCLERLVARFAEVQVSQPPPYGGIWGRDGPRLRRPVPPWDQRAEVDVADGFPGRRSHPPAGDRGDPLSAPPLSSRRGAAASGTLGTSPGPNSLPPGRKG